MVDEGGLFGDFVTSLLDEMGRSLVDIIRIEHASIKGVEFAANRENTLNQGIVIGFNDIGRNVEVKLVIGKGETETARLALATDDGRKVGEFGNEELIIVNKGVIIVE